MTFRVQVCLTVIILHLLSCERNKENKGVDGISFIASSESYQIDSSIYKTASIFYDSLQNKSSIKELFIDKIYEDQTILTYRAKPVIPNYFENNKPSFILYLHTNVSFYVFTGVEDLITGDLQHLKKTADLDTTSTYYLCMSFSVDKNNHFILNYPCNLPFGVNINNVIQPEIDIRKYKGKAE